MLPRRRDRSSFMPGKRSLCNPDSCISAFKVLFEKNIYLSAFEYIFINGIKQFS
jgi:hypothetical protein